MNYKILPLAIFSLAMTACAPSPSKPVPSNMVPCPTGGSNVINIVATPGQFSVAPPRLCIPFNASADTDIKVNFAGNHAAGVITLSPKSGSSPTWLSVSNPGTNPDQATITVPAGTPVDTYFYDITATGWGTIDPMITVE